MRFSSLLRFVLLDYDRSQSLQTLPKLRQVFTLVIILQLLSTLCVAPVVATTNSSDGRLGGLETHAEDECTPDNGTGSCVTTRTTSPDCYPGGGRTTETKMNTDDPGSDDTPTRHNTDSGTTESGPSNTHSTTTEPNTKSSQGSDQTNVPESGLLPDINSPVIALIGVLCVIGGLIALTR
jgi:hypothetical protein